MRTDRARKALEVITALENRNHFSCRGLSAISMISIVNSEKSASARRNRPNGSPRRESKPAEMRTSDGRNSSIRGRNLPRNAPRICSRPAPAGNGQLSVVLYPLPSLFLQDACAWIPGGLVRAEKVNRRIRVENILGAVAVVNIPIDDGDAVDAIAVLRITGGDGDVVEQAEAHAAICRSVMAGRADDAEGVLAAPFITRSTALRHVPTARSATSNERA